MIKGKCPLCFDESEKYPNNSTDSILIKCNNCGRFIYFNNNFDDIDKNRLASFLFYNKGYTLDKKEKCFVIDKTKAYNISGSETISFSYLTNEIVNNWYPKTFSEKVDMFLLYLSKTSKFVGDLVLFTYEGIESAMFVRRDYSNYEKSAKAEKTQHKFFSDYLVSEKYISLYMNGYALLPKGLKRVDELQKSDENNKDVFVSMAFNKGTEKTRESIRQGIISAGYSPKFIDEIIHNHQIVPEMFRLIRECKFLILDISDPNYGAYYEAGYALGYGKEVIICCNKNVFEGKQKFQGKELSEQEMKKFGKYLTPHFDIAQKQILVWKSYKDLTIKLSEWIKSID